MQVYVAEGHTYYEGFNILGVFSTKDAALVRLCYEDCNGYDELSIVEYTVDGSTEWGYEGNETVVRKGRVWKVV